MHFPLITYHEILSDDQVNRQKHAVRVEEFERQLSYLSDDGYASLNLLDIHRSDRRDENRTRRIAITFDDGHYSDYSHALPILKRCNLVGNFFITTDWVSKPGYVSWNNLIEIKDAGMSIQSHGVSHRFLPDLTISDLQKELRNSKRTLEQRLGISVDFISIPSGFVSKRVVEMAKDENYRGVCTSVPGLNPIPKHFSVLNRFMITRKTSFDTFKRIVNGDVELARSLKRAYEIKLALRRAIGNKLYYKIWSAFSKEV